MDSGKKYMARWGYLAASIIVFIIELIIALYVHDRIIRPYIGDMLVVVLVYCFVRVFVPRGMKRLPLYVFLFAVCVENDIRNQRYWRAVFPSGRAAGAAGERCGQDYPGFCF